MILDEIQPTAGCIKKGTNLDIVYFDQHRQSIDLEKSVQDNVAEGRTEITLGTNRKHVVSFLQDFLFTPERIRTPAKALSGGELNRLVLAKLFSKPSNLMILDEPTNDLDIETLELLEELVNDYQGTVILVSHDRSFVDHTVTSSFVFRENEPLLEIVGGYTDWVHYKNNHLNAVKENKADVNAISSTTPVKTASKTQKLTYKDKLELERLPDEIASLENQIEILQKQINDGAFFSLPVEETQPILKQFQQFETALETKFERWEILDKMSQSIN